MAHAIEHDRRLDEIVGRTSPNSSTCSRRSLTSWHRRRCPERDIHHGHSRHGLIEALSEAGVSHIFANFGSDIRR